MEQNVMRKIILLFFVIFIQTGAMASDTPNTKITRILVGPSYGTKVFLTISTKPTATPDCQINTGYNYVFDGSTETGKMMLSIALTAYTANKEVWLGGANKCSLFGNVEDLKHIVIH
ncbi:hypothetical protein SOPP22_01345 [Shewanella sp. OPT22]|nr:hypothetical protein SOPP22_01345 [Shewanella sp. OPT22]